MTNFIVQVNGRGTYGDVHVLYSKFMVRDGARPIIVFHHPHGGAANATLNPEVSPGSVPMIEYFVQNGYIVVVGDFRKAGPTGTGAQWGNNDNHLGISEAVAFGQKYGGSTTKKFLLVGLSMGALVCLGYAARYPSAVAGVLGIIPAIDLAKYKTPGPNGPFGFDGVTPYSFAATIDLAYPPGYTDAAFGATYNPMYRAVSSNILDFTKIQLWWGDADTFASKAMIDPFYSAIKTRTPAATIELKKIPAKGVQHTDAALLKIPLTQVLAFAQSCVT